MAIVNATAKTDRIATYKDFAEVFLGQIFCIGKDYDEIRVVFDRYLQDRFKQHTRTRELKTSLNIITSAMEQQFKTYP